MNMIVDNYTDPRVKKKDNLVNSVLTGVFKINNDVKPYSSSSLNLIFLFAG